MINSERLCSLFEELVRIDSPSGEELKICLRLEKIFRELGASVFIDNSQSVTGCETGNLVAFFPGTVDAEPLMLSGHMDTVEPGRGIEPVLKNGIYTSAGDTILGADDKSALAIIIEVMRTVKETGIPVCPVEVVITTCEEIGLMGAKALDVSSLKSRFGYILDSTDAEGIVVKAPSATRFTFRIYGKAAHAGAQPEKGLSAIHIASTAVASLELGRIDDETTCNIGKFHAGTATNIIPDLAVVEGEARSHSPEKLEKITENIVRTFENAVEKARLISPDPAFPVFEKEVITDFHHTDIPLDHRVVRLAVKAAGNIGRRMETVTVGGGSDANVLFGKGIAAGVLGTGMRDLHTTSENISVEDMTATAELILEILRIHSSGNELD
jgi:tripeptide aminopeptidase